jgi:uracil-DNA glycosylase
MYEVKKASIVRDSGLLRVLPLEDNGQDGFRSLYVVECPTKNLTFRTGRPVYDDDGKLMRELILVVDKPDFDIQSIVGMHLSSICQTETAGQ